MAWVGTNLRDHPKTQALDFAILFFNSVTKKTCSIKLIMYFIICYRLFKRIVKLFHYLKTSHKEKGLGREGVKTEDRQYTAGQNAVHGANRFQEPSFSAWTIQCVQLCPTEHRGELRHRTDTRMICYNYC